MDHVWLSRVSRLEDRDGSPSSVGLGSICYAEKKPSTTRIVVDVGVVDRDLRISVRDNGAPISKNPVAGLGMVVLSVPLVNVTRGGKKPLLVALTSNFAEASGVVVPIPVCASPIKERHNKKNKILNCFMHHKIKEKSNIIFSAYLVLNL